MTCTRANKNDLAGAARAKVRNRSVRRVVGADQIDLNGLRPSAQFSCTTVWVGSSLVQAREPCQLSPIASTNFYGSGFAYTSTAGSPFIPMRRFAVNLAPTAGMCAPAIASPMRGMLPYTHSY